MPYTDAHECPEGVRITDGPRYTLRRVPWRPDQKFYKVTDLGTGIEYYRTSLEAALLCEVNFRTFKSRVSKHKVKTLFHNRWEVQRVPQFVFAKETSRTHKIIRDYFWRY